MNKKILNELSPIGKKLYSAFVTNTTQSLLWYRNIYYFNAISGYEKGEDFKKDVRIHSLILDQHMDTTNDFRSLIRALNDDLTVRSIPIYEESVTVEFLKVIAELAKDNKYNKTQYKALINILTAESNFRFLLFDYMRVNFDDNIKNSITHLFIDILLEVGSFNDFAKIYKTEMDL